MDQCQSFQTNRHTEDRRSSGSQSSGSKLFRDKQDKFKKQPYQSSVKVTIKILYYMKAIYSFTGRYGNTFIVI